MSVRAKVTERAISRYPTTARKRKNSRTTHHHSVWPSSYNDNADPCEVNQAVKNNPNKFPEGYIIELDKKEKEEVVKIFDNLGNLLYSPSNPKAFTERGLYMLATILKGPKAEETTIAIVEAYAKLRELAQVIAEVSQHEDDKAEQQSLL